jgi:hypothetical protein
MIEFLVSYWWLIIIACFFGLGFVQWFIEYLQESERSKAANELVNLNALKELRQEYQEKYHAFVREEKEDDNTSRKLEYYQTSREVPYQELIKKCPSCNYGYLRPTKGQYGKFMGCSSFPKCKYTQSISTSKFEYKTQINGQIQKELKKALEV